MNAAQPIALEDGDYVLFMKQGEVSEDDLVIASRLEDTQKKEYTYMVRKLSKKILYSESSEIDDKYKPVPVGDDTQILGYVVAVAKQYFPLVEKELYRILLGKVAGDKKKAEELVTAENKRKPTIDKIQLLRNTILKWDSDH